METFYRSFSKAHETQRSMISETWRMIQALSINQRTVNLGQSSAPATFVVQQRMRTGLSKAHSTAEV